MTEDFASFSPTINRSKQGKACALEKQELHLLQQATVSRINFTMLGDKNDILTRMFMVLCLAISKLHRFCPRRHFPLII